MATEPRRLLITLKSAVEKKETGFLGDDIIDPVKKEIYEYAVNETKKYKNEFPLTTEYGEDSSLVTPEGFAAPLTTPGNRQQDHYTRKLSPKLLNELTRTSDSGVLSFQDDPFLIKKGNQDNKYPTADDYYRDIEDNGDDSQVVKRVKRTLLENGGYNEDKQYSTTVNRTNDDENVVGSIGLNELGTAAPRKFPDVSQAQEFNILKIKDLKKVGLQMLFAGSGELVKINPNEPYVDTLNQLAGVVPSTVRLGQKVPLKKMLAASAMELIKPGYTAKSDVEDIGDSYGAPNNPAVPFESGNLLSRALTYTALLTALYGLLKVTNLSVTDARRRFSLKFQEGRYSRTDRGQKRFLGSYTGHAGETNPELGKSSFTETRNPYEDCMSKGAEVFFGFSPTNLLSIAGQTAQINNITQGMTFYNTVLLELLRSARDLSVATIGLSGNKSPSVPNNFTEVSANGVGSILDSISTLKAIENNKVIKFFDVLAQIGDTAIEAEKRGAVIDATGFATEEMETDADRIPESLEVSLGNNLTKTVYNPAVLPGKGRFSRGFNNGSHTMRADSIKSLLTMPAGISFANQQFGNGFVPHALLNEAGFFVADDSENFDQESGRIKKETVKKMEEYLEKDYMPFYFHDLRTNEIISFHAFINEISENFTADYNSTEGFGRLSPVQVYKSTSREISLAFSVVSFDDSDLDSLWYKINRFMMLLYPQWTKGREISIGQGGKMIQPFSQQIGASPLIRMRVGDLFKSNYSKVALARLFGLGSSRNPSNDDLKISRFQENAEAVANARAARIGRDSDITAAYERQYRKEFQEGDVFRITNGEYTRVIESSPAAASPIRRGQRNPPLPRNQPYRATGSERITFVRFDLVNPDIIIGSTLEDGRTVSIIIQKERTSPDLDFIKDNIRSRSNSTEPQLQQTQQTSEDVQNFFSTTGNDANPIVRAFENNGGTGLAGFIKSVNVGYPENATWITGRFNSRVPTLIQLSITFSPVHDIEPGLDHNGFMRAPIWNVGNIIGKIFTDKDSFDTRQQSLNQANQAFNKSGNGQ